MSRPVLLDNTVLTNLALVRRITAGYRSPVVSLDDLVTGSRAQEQA